MGCGGSRADTIIEPRYHESWTRETESTWLTNTDIETPVPGVNSKNCCSAEEMSSRMVVENAKYAGKGTEGSHKEKRMVNTATQCGKLPLNSTGSIHQRRSRRPCHEQMSTDSRMRASNETSGAPPKDVQPVNDGSRENITAAQSCDGR
ncbi:brain and acute leukemia cytoplasmic protein-like isoform X1 [Osmerus eperlanus]|uniref:brain and acute leukemia cytoplasmic protein-like isoform X1 n=1 Tax=Osmerus eperlanus TaxID=29151 RepID=UPI002E0E7979